MAAEAAAAPRQAFLPIATIIFAGRGPVKRFIPFSEIEGGRCDIRIWPTLG